MQRRMQELVPALLGPGAVAIDVGALSGETTIPLALLASHTIAFEPDATAYEALLANARLQRLSAPQRLISVHNLGAAPPSAYALGAVQACGGSRSPPPMKPPSVRDLLEFVRRRYGDETLRRVTFVRIDATRATNQSELVDGLRGLVSA